MLLCAEVLNIGIEMKLWVVSDWHFKMEICQCVGVYSGSLIKVAPKEMAMTTTTRGVVRYKKGPRSPIWWSDLIRCRSSSQTTQEFSLHQFVVLCETKNMALLYAISNKTSRRFFWRPSTALIFIMTIVVILQASDSEAASLDCRSIF